MRTIQRTIRWATGVAFLVGCFAQLAKGQELTREVAAELAALAEEVRPKEVTVGPIHDVEETLEPGTVATKAKCVVFIAPKQVGGNRRRKICYRTFYYDQTWGWYLYSEKEIRGGEALQVFSQNAGVFELR